MKNSKKQIRIVRIRQYKGRPKQLNCYKKAVARQQIVNKFQKNLNLEDDDGDEGERQ